ncbi:MAG: alanine racemase [Actinomycetes bacterium]
MAVEGNSRPAWAEIDLDALRSNARHMTGRLNGAALCAVVKADGYGHGAVPAALALLEGGAHGFAVAIVDEGIELRQAHITAPILLLSEPPVDAMVASLAAGLTPTITTLEGVERVSAAAKQIGGKHQIHIKIDTGMHRTGTDQEGLVSMIEALAPHDQLVIEGLYTHLAVADEAGEESEAFTRLQIERFDDAVALATRMGVTPAVLHIANSAGALAVPAARRAMVRSGLALYGEVPSREVSAHAATESPLALTPALTIKAAVSAVRHLDAGDRPSYGRRRPLERAGRVATVPIGYADGFPRRLFDAGHEVLIGGRRFPLAGSVTMDQIVVDVGDAPVSVGDEVVLLGAQGDERISATEWADHLGTIVYEVLCGIGPRMPRRYIGSPLVAPTVRRRWWRPRP